MHFFPRDFQQKKLSAVKDVKWQPEALGIFGIKPPRGLEWMAGASRVKRLDIRDDTRVDNSHIRKYLEKKRQKVKATLNDK